MGNWIVAQQAQDSKDGKGIGADNLTTVAFPGAIAGGKGDGTETLGGIAGYELNASAPPEAAKFLEFFASREQQKPVAEQGINIPTALGSADDLKDPILQAAAKAIAASSKHQNFIDQDLGRVFSDVSVALAAGDGAPASVPQDTRSRPARHPLGHHPAAGRLRAREQRTAHAQRISTDTE